MVDDVWMVSEGNPFVVVESMQAIREEARDSGRFGSPLARSVRDFVAARLDRLGERGTPSGGYGSRHRKGLLVRAPGSCRPGLQEREAAETVEELVRRRVLDTVGDRLEFSHDWIRRVADDRLLPATRRDTPRRRRLCTWRTPPRAAGRRGGPARQPLLTGGRLPQGTSPIWSGFAELAAQRYAPRRGLAGVRARTRQRSSSYRRRSTTARAHRAALHERIGDMYALQWSADAGRRTTGAASSSGRQQARRIPRRERVSTPKLRRGPNAVQGAFKTPPSEQEVIG